MKQEAIMRFLLTVLLLTVTTTGLASAGVVISEADMNELIEAQNQTGEELSEIVDDYLPIVNKAAMQFDEHGDINWDVQIEIAQFVILATPVLEKQLKQLSELNQIANTENLEYCSTISENFSKEACFQAIETRRITRTTKAELLTVDALLTLSSQMINAH
jgi:hypothetical protein